MGAAASTAYRLGQETSGGASVGAGLGGVASAGGAALARPARAGRRSRAPPPSAASAPRCSPARPAQAASGAGAAELPATRPDWARQLRSEQTARHHRQAALQAIREGDRGGAAATPDIKEKED